MKFKLIPTKTTENIIDRRKRLTGNVCRTISKKKLYEIIDKLNIKLDKQEKINTICNIIELTLRKKQRKSVKENKNERWFYDYFEYYKHFIEK